MITQESEFGRRMREKHKKAYKKWRKHHHVPSLKVFTDRIRKREKRRELLKKFIKSISKKRK